MPLYFNTSNRPVVYNIEGQLFGAREWLETDETDVLRRAIEIGDVIELPPVTKPAEEPKRRRRKAADKTEDTEA